MNDTTFQPNTPQVPLQLNEACEALLTATARWSRFLGIFTFIMAGIMFVCGLIILLSASVLAGYADFAGMNLIVLGITYMICPVLYIFPGLYLYRYAVRIQEALANRDETALTEGLRQHKKLFKFFGVFSIIAIVFVLLFIVIMAGFAMAM